MQENKPTISRSTVVWTAIALFGLGLTIYGVPVTFGPKTTLSLKTSL